MSGINRTQLVLGPGHLLFGGAPTGSGDSIAWTPTNTLFCKKATAQIKTTWREIAPGGYGRIDRRKGDEVVTLHCSSEGGFNSAVMALLWPYGGTAIGTSIFGSADVPIGFNSLAGQQLVLWNAAITKMPNITLGASKPIYGDFEITGVIRQSLPRTDTMALYTISAVTFSALTMNKPTLADFLTLPTVATWSIGSPEVITPARGGWEITFSEAFDWQTSDDFGTYDARFRSLEVRAKCIPINYSESRWADLKAQGTGNDIGTSARIQADLTLVCGGAGAGGPTLVLKNASFDEAPMQWEDNKDRIESLTMIARRDISSGYGNLFTIAMT
jgi:hypothetical protein